MNLSRGSIRLILSGSIASDVVLQVKKVTGKSSPTNPAIKYEAILTDGVDTAPSILASQCHRYVESQQVREGTIIQLKSAMKAKGLEHMDVIFISDLNVLGQGVVPSSAPPQSTPLPDVYGLSTNGSNSYGSSPYGNNNAHGYNDISFQQPNQQQRYQSGVANSFQQPIPAKPFGSNEPSFQTPNPYGQYGGNQQYGGGNQYHFNSYGATNSVNPSYGSAGHSSRPIVRDDGDQNVIPIAALNPYANKWTIKARVQVKSQIKSWSNAKGEGQLFSIDLIDRDGTAIRGTFFKDAVTKFYNVIEEQQVYTFSGGKIKIVTDHKYTSIKNNYEITFDVNSEIHPCRDDASIKEQSYNFVPIANLQDKQPNDFVDIIGIVKLASDVSELSIAKQGGKIAYKRDLTVIDQTNHEVRVTLWGDKAQNDSYGWNKLPIVAFRGLKVSDYGGRSLGASGNTSFTFDPKITEAFQLQQWRNQFNGMLPEGQSMSSVSSVGGTDRSLTNEPIEKRKTFGSIKDEGLGLGDNADFVVTKATITYIKHDNDPWYNACPTCNKKVSEVTNGTQCEKCNKLVNPQKRYIVNMTMADPTGDHFVTVFTEEAEKVLGCKAEDLSRMKDTGDMASYEGVFQKALFKPFIAKLRVKQEEVKDEKRMKYTVSSISPVDYSHESRLMLDALRKYQSIPELPSPTRF